MPVDVGKAVGYLDLDTTGFKKGFSSALEQLRVFGDKSASLTTKLDAVSSTFTSAGRSMTIGLTVPIATAGVAVVKTAADFESAMSKTMAVTDTTALGYEKTYTMLSDAAQEMGATTRYSASEAADALYYMSLAGWDANESVAGLPGVLALAASSAMDLGDASDLVTDYLTAFGKSADYSMEMADMLAYAQANSNTTTQLLGDAFGNCATQAHAFGAEMSETTSYLSALANSGLKGSEAGTALSAVFRDITQKMEDGKIMIGETAVAVQDEEGNFRSLTDILRDVSLATEGMGSAQKSAALMNTFTARSIKAVNILLDEGADSLEGFNQELLNSAGTASKQSQEMLNNLSGQLTILKSALEGLAISFGNLLLPAIKKLTEGVQKVVTWLNNLDENQKKTLLRILEIVAAIGPVLLIIGKVVGAVNNVIKIVGMLKPVITAIFSIISANPLTLIIAAIAAVVAGLIHLYNTSEEFRAFVDKACAAIKNIVSSVVSAISKFFTETIPNAIKTVIEFFAQLPEKIGSALKNALNKVSDWVKNLVTKAKEVGTNVINAIVQFFDTLPEKIGYAIGYALGKFVSWIADLATKAKEIGPKVIDAIVKFFSELPGKIQDLMSKAKQKVVDWATGIRDWAKSALPNLISHIVSFFEELPHKLLSVGENLITGLWNGIRSKFEWLIGNVKSFAGGVLQGFKDALGISSPSKKMIEQGKYLIMGLAKGIEDYTNLVAEPIKNFTDTVLQDMQTGLAEPKFEQFSAGAYSYQNNRATNAYGQPVGSSYVNTYNFYSPKALDPIEAAKAMKQTSQQLAMGM